MLDLCCCTCFSLIRQAGATLWLWHTGSHCSDFSCCGGQALGCAGFSSCGSQALEHRLNSCDTWTQLLHGMWDLTGSGIEPTSLVLANGFFITEPPSEVKDTLYHWATKWSERHSVVFNSLQPHGLYSSWNSPGQNTGVGSLSLLQGICPTQGSNPVLPHCRQILYQLSHKGSLWATKEELKYKFLKCFFCSSLCWTEWVRLWPQATQSSLLC